MYSIPFNNVSKVEGLRSYWITSVDDLKWLAKVVNEGNSCKGVRFLLQNNLKMNAYKIAYSKETGLVVVWDELGQVLFGIGTDIEGTLYNTKVPSSRDVIYYGDQLLSSNIGDLNKGSYVWGSVTCGANVYTVQEWEPIGTVEHPFEGRFEGRCQSIEGLIIIGGMASYKGLFGVLGEGSQINQLKIANSYVSGKEYIGSMVGYAQGSRFSSDINEGCVAANFHTGGLIGCIKNGKIDHARNGAVGDPSKGTVSGGQYTGGVVGRTINSEIYTSENSGFVKTPSVMEVGGITGYAEIEETIKWPKLNLAVDCHNLGEIICRSPVNDGCTAGIIGTVRNYSPVCEGLIKNCWNTGDITSTTEGTGGIVGYMEHGTVECCWNSGNILGTVGVGGVVGYAYCGSTIKDCYNAPNATIKSEKYYVGGIVGGSYSQYFEGKVNKKITISDSFNDGEVICYWNDNDLPPPAQDIVDTTGGCAGGIIGYACNTIFPGYTSYLTSIRNCGNTGTVRNALSANTGGVLGYCKDATLENCYNLGHVEGEDDTGGIVGNITNIDREDDRIRNCYNAGPVVGGLRVGAVAGSLIGPSSIESCYAASGCVKAGSGGLDGVTFYGRGMFTDQPYTLLERLNGWIGVQQEPCLYIPWYSINHYYPLLGDRPHTE